MYFAISLSSFVGFLCLRVGVSEQAVFLIAAVFSLINMILLSFLDDSKLVLDQFRRPSEKGESTQDEVYQRKQK